MGSAEPLDLGSLLRARALEGPDRPFIHCQGQVVTRGELLRDATAYAQSILAMGIAPGDRVALLLGNGLPFVIAFFGNALAGVVSVPINVLLKGPEVRYQLEKTRARLLVYGPAFAEAVGAVRRIDGLSSFICAGRPPFKDATFVSLLAGAPGHSTVLAGIKVRPSDVAAVLFTSGTTGAPKGAMLTHGNYLANARQIRDFVGMGPGDRPLCVLPLFHVNAQVVTLVTPLFAGAGMALLPGFQKDTFLSQVAELGATSFSAVPTIYALLLALSDKGEHDLSRLRYAICGAAPMPVEVFTRFEETFRTKIVEGYGLTEGTCASCVNPVNGPRKVGTIGIPLPGQEMKLVDDAGGDVLAPGGVGEIVIRGPNVFAGYLFDPAATAATLASGWLHTGDLATRDADGYYTIVGRKKEMIIRGGENIYPKEIEEVVYQDPRVLEAAVVGLPDAVWGEEVALFVVPRDGASASEDGLRAFLSERLASYKVPHRILIKESLPKTATGKIRKGELRDSVL